MAGDSNQYALFAIFGEFYRFLMPHPCPIMPFEQILHSQSYFSTSSMLQEQEQPEHRPTALPQALRGGRRQVTIQSELPYHWLL